MTSDHRRRVHLELPSILCALYLANRAFGEKAKKHYIILTRKQTNFEDFIEL